MAGVSKSTYEGAVNGRRAFREAFRQERDRRKEADDLLREFSEAFGNRGETTSLHTWNERLKTADAKARKYLAQPGAGAADGG